MNNRESHDDLKDLLKRSVTPASHSELRHDLWPQMRARLAQEHTAVRPVPWFDWALAALAGAALIFFPGIVPALLYHL